jgi:hypothetical protein
MWSAIWWISKSSSPYAYSLHWPWKWRQPRAVRSPVSGWVVMASQRNRQSVVSPGSV